MIRGRLGRTLSSGLKIPFGYIYSAVLFCIGLLLIEIIQRMIIKGYRQRDIDVVKEKYI
jgi:TRAP-type C4-dicarboxylate transport system permease small subunit